MIDESAKTREKCLYVSPEGVRGKGSDQVDRWYTSLIGKASSVPLLIGKLGEHQVGTLME